MSLGYLITRLDMDRRGLEIDAKYGVEKVADYRVRLNVLLIVGQREQEVINVQDNTEDHNVQAQKRKADSYDPPQVYPEPIDPIP